MTLAVDIRKQLGRFRLDVSFEAEDEILALLGPSGCGKSMTLKCIAGIETPDEGSIVLNGRTLFDREKGIDLSPQQRRAGYLFQEYALFPTMDVEENVMTGIREGKRKEKRSIARAMLASLRLDGLGHLKPCQLSGGQKQRVALARILVNGPEVLLLDEPFAALDSNLKWELQLELSETLKGFPGSIIFVSHNRKEVYSLSDSVSILSGGRSEEKTPVRELFKRPGTVAAAAMTGCSNISRVSQGGRSSIFCQDWGIELETDQPISPATAFAGIPSKGLRRGTAGERNTFRLTIERIIPDITGIILMLETPGGTSLRMDLDHREWNTLNEPGEVGELDVRFPPEEILLLRTSETTGTGTS